MTAIQSILDQHAEGAAFHWMLREGAVRAPHYSLRDLAGLDERLEGHLDGLRIAAEAGWDAARAGLGSGEPDELFVAAVLAVEHGGEERLAVVREAALAAPASQRGLAAALAWVPFARSRPAIEVLLADSALALRAAALSAAAAHGWDPGPPLGAGLDADDPALRAAAARAAGRLGLVDLLPRLRAGLVDHGSSLPSDPLLRPLRFAAAWSAARLGDAAAAGTLAEIARQGGARADTAAQLAVRRLPADSALAWLKELAGRGETLRLAAVALAALGDPAHVPWLIDVMSEPAAARAAGEAFSWISGLDLAYADLEGEPPADFQAGPTENAADEDVALDPDEDSPWPHQERIAAWWRANGARFPGGTRHLMGLPISPENLRRVLREGRQRQRAAAALEAGLADPRTPLFDTRAPARRQARALAGTA